MIYHCEYKDTIILTNKMKLCIIDPAAKVPTLKTLFPEAEYYAHEPDDFFRFGHDTNHQFFNQYGFYYRTDWESISSTRYDYVFIVVPLADFYDPLSPEHRALS